MGIQPFILFRPACPQQHLVAPVCHFPILVSRHDVPVRQI